MHPKKLLTSSSIILASAFFLSNPNSISAQEVSNNDETTLAPSHDTGIPEETTHSENTDTNTQTEPETASEEANISEVNTSQTTEIPADNVETNETPSENNELTILHTNDIHGRLDAGRGVIGVAKLDTIATNERQNNPNTLLLDAGDAFQGLPISNATKGEDMARIMNEIGYDAMAVGNHEFDFSFDQAKKYKELLNFPILSANTYLNGARVFDAATIIDKDTSREGDEVVVIGVTTPETSTKTHPNNVVGVTFADPITEVKNAITEIENQAKVTGKTYTRYVILAHLGIDDTTKYEWRGSTLAEALSTFEALTGKDVVVIDGHSHTVHSARYANVVYNQTGSYLSNIGKVTLKAPGVIEAGLITYDETASIDPSERISTLVNEIKDRYAQENAQVYREQNPIELNGQRENVRVRETNLGNAVADALYQYGQTGFSNKTDLAVTNGGGLRASIAKDAPITKGDVIAVLPFGNIISQIEVKGAQIREMFNRSFSSPIQNKDGQSLLDENGQPLLEALGAFLQVSGARVYYDTNLELPQRILAVEILDHETGQYVPLDDNKIYYLATNDFVAAGGDGYTMLGGAREEGPSLDAVFADYIKTTDLENYATINPNSRLISISKSAYDELNQQTPQPETPEQPLVPSQPETPNQPKKPNQSETPEQPQTPTEPSQPEQPSNQGEQSVPDKTETSKEETSAEPKPILPTEQTTTNQQASSALPKTGETHPIFNLSALTILAGLGLVITNKKKEEN